MVPPAGQRCANDYTVGSARGIRSIGQEVRSQEKVAECVLLVRKACVCASERICAVARIGELCKHCGLLNRQKEKPP